MWVKSHLCDYILFNLIKKLMENIFRVINALIGTLSLIIVFLFELFVKITLSLLFLIAGIVLLTLLPYKILITKKDWSGAFEGKFGKYVEYMYDYGTDFKYYDLCEKIRDMYFD